MENEDGKKKKGKVKMRGREEGEKREVREKNCERKGEIER